MNKSQAVIPAKAGIQEDLPKGWLFMPLGKLRGSTAKSINPSDQPDEVFELYSVPSFSDGAPEVITGKEIGSSKRIVEPNTVLLSKINPRINRVWIVGPAGKHKQISSPEWVEFFPSDVVEPKYLMYFMQNYKFREHLSMNVSGVGGSLTRIRPKVAEDYEIPLAPKEQQKRIVAKIEELFSHIDAGIEALKKAKQLLKQYRQSVLKAAVTGELTKEWREANKTKLEPASQLLERILKERRQKWEEQQLEQFKAKGKMPKDDKWKEKYKEPVQVENVAELEALPGTWEWVCLDSLIVDGPQNGLYLPKTKYGSGVPIVRIDDFQDGYVRPYDNLQRVNANKSEVEMYSLQTGNLVINRVNSPTHLGKCMVVKEGYAPCLFESNMMKSELSSNISADYVDYYIQSKFGRSRLIRNAKWAVNQASINQQDVKNTEITLPPFEEQTEIARLVSEKFDGIDRLNNELDIQLSKAEKNRQSILASAFSGKV